MYHARGAVAAGCHKVPDSTLRAAALSAGRQPKPYHAGARVLFVAWAVTPVMVVSASDQHPGVTTAVAALHEIWGQPTNGLRPVLYLQRGSGEWNLNLDFLFQTNFPRHAWLRTTNRVGALLHLWPASGTELPVRSRDALDALNLPRETTVSDVMRGVHPASWRGNQWLQTGFDESPAGEVAGLGGYSLASVFGTTITNQALLSLTPLAYRVAPDGKAARLVQFPEIRVRLLPDGNVQPEGP